MIFWKIIASLKQAFVSESEYGVSIDISPFCANSVLPIQKTLPVIALTRSGASPKEFFGRRCGARKITWEFSCSEAIGPCRKSDDDIP